MNKIDLLQLYYNYAFPNVIFECKLYINIFLRQIFYSYFKCSFVDNSYNSYTVSIYSTFIKLYFHTKKAHI